MEKARSKLQPQIHIWHEDLPLPTAAIEAGDRNVQPDPGFDVRYVDANVLELSRATSSERGMALMFGGGVSIGYVAMLPFFVEMYRDGNPKEAPIMASFLVLMLLVLAVLLINMIKKAVRTPLDLPILFDRSNQKIFALEYLVKPNPFAKWEMVIMELDWPRVEAAIGKFYKYKTVWYGLILAQCEQGTTKLEGRIILKQDVSAPMELHHMWAYIRCYMNEGPERLPEVQPIPRDVNFRRCLFGSFPLLDPTEDGRRLRARMGRTELIVSVAAASVFALGLFWLFLPVGVFEYIAQRLAPKPRWPAEVISRIPALRESVANPA
ncbi:hypothetical protein N5B55_20315 [Ralstonia pickettii]|uniref:DUF6708 domain-containing protein n=1 Tax=Ralstonia pickettii TaxID=329 RepID=UPI002714A84D|nr:DUF6708 domain-containing protein [Ralstonia pickettii]WKZ87110.1 hypothetical protein N5B55_20315 [Ralstonia pickettii]